MQKQLQMNMCTVICRINKHMIFRSNKLGVFVCKKMSVKMKGKATIFLSFSLNPKPF